MVNSVIPTLSIVAAPNTPSGSLLLQTRLGRRENLSKCVVAASGTVFVEMDEGAQHTGEASACTGAAAARLCRRSAPRLLPLRPSAMVTVSPASR